MLKLKSNKDNNFILLDSIELGDCIMGEDTELVVFTGDGLSDCKTFQTPPETNAIVDCNQYLFSGTVYDDNQHIVCELTGASSTGTYKLFGVEKAHVLVSNILFNMVNNLGHELAMKHQKNMSNKTDKENPITFYYPETNNNKFSEPGTFFWNDEF